LRGRGKRCCPFHTDFDYPVSASFPCHKSYCAAGTVVDNDLSYAKFWRGSLTLSFRYWPKQWEYIKVQLFSYTKHTPSPLHNTDLFILYKETIAVYYVLLTVHLGTIFVNNQLDVQFFFMYIYFYSLHVSGSHVPIIRRISCISTTSGVCHSV